MINDDAERDDALLALKEAMRQHNRSIEKYGEENFEATLNTSEGRKLFDLIQALRRGDISLADFEEQNSGIRELIEEKAVDLDDVETIMSLRAEHEAKTKGLSEAALTLLAGSNRAASEGLSKEEWIIEVLRGHQSDEWAQLGCLRHIVTLWADGPWSWPRDLSIKA
jgi:hypothetical protein